jgi:hypothetical protein
LASVTNWHNLSITDNFFTGEVAMNIKYKYLNKRFTNNAGQSGFVLNYVNAKEVYFQFDSGYVGCFRMSDIRKGIFKDKLSPSIYSVGFIGDGEYKPTENGKITKVYAAWQSMLKRCYDPKTQIRQPTYKGCSVAKEWHNFQNFSLWYENNYPTDGRDYHLDKDALIKGNKVYSSHTCCFLSAQQNSEVTLAKHYTFISPEGKIIEVFNLNKFCRENNLRCSDMHNVSTGRQKSCKGWKSP